MDFIKYLDFFNIKFSFYTNNQPNNQNIFGGIMTFIYILASILIFVLFSYDDLKRLNPITTMSEISDSERKLVNMNKEKIWIPFRVVDYENQFVDHRGILHIIPYLIEGRYNKSIGMDLKYTLLKYKLCNETSMAERPNHYKISVPLNQLFCIERDDILFGGNWNHEFLNYIEINLFLCEEGVAYNSSDPRCSKLDNYLQNLNSSLLFDFHFPMVQFQPTNLKTPIQIIYKNYYYRLSSYSYKIEKLYIKENILSDDKNMIKSRFKNSSCWGMSTLYSDDYFLPNNYDAISDNSNTSRIYALNIYMDDGLVYYTRTYKKIFLIISNVFPIIRLILYFIKKFTQSIKKSLVKRDLIGLIFDNKRIRHRKLFSKKFENLKKNVNQRNKILIVSNKSENEFIKDKTISNHEFSINDLNNNNINNNKINIIFNNNYNQKKYDLSEIYYNKNIFKKKPNTITENKLIKNENILYINKNSPKKKFSFFGSFKVDEPYKKNIIINKNGNSKYIFPNIYYFLDIIFDNLINPKKFFCISKNYFIIYNFMCQIYDISTYIILFKQFNSLDKLIKEKIYENDEVCPSKPYNKINISDEKKIEKINKDLKGNKSILFSNNLL